MSKREERYEKVSKTAKGRETQTDRQTDNQTDRQDENNMPPIYRSGGIKIQINMIEIKK